MTISVTMTDLIILPQSQIAPTPGAGLRGSVEPGTGFESWFMAGTDTGDGGGGQVVGLFRIPQDDWFYTVTAVHCSVNSNTVPENGRWNITAADFEQYQQVGQNVAWTHVADISGGNQSLKNADWVPRYLGRAITPDSDLQFQWGTNTDTLVYVYRIAGLRSMRPGIPWYNALQQARAL